MFMSTGAAASIYIYTYASKCIVYSVGIQLATNGG